MFLFRARLDHDLNSEVLPERYTTLFHLDPTLVFEKVGDWTGNPKRPQGCLHA